MTTFSEGDLIKATKGETVIRGRVVSLDRGLIIQACGWDVDSFERSGFTLTLIKKAAPVLPTEWGYYSDNEGDIWRLSTSGDWVCIEYPHISDNPSACVPFARLEPVAETAKKVLERVLDVLERGGIRTFPNEFGNIGAEFGVTS